MKVHVYTELYQVLCHCISSINKRLLTYRSCEVAHQFSDYLITGPEIGAFMSTASNATLCMSAVLIASLIVTLLRYHVMVSHTLLLRSRLNIDYCSTHLGMWSLYSGLRTRTEVITPVNISDIISPQLRYHVDRIAFV